MRDRVLLLLEYPLLNGAERSLLAVVDEIRHAGFDLLSAAPPEGPVATLLRRHSIQVLPLLLRDSNDRRLGIDVLRKQIERLISDTSPALVHANSLSLGRLAGPVTNRLGVPALGHLRDILRLSRQAVRDLNRNTGLIAVSRATRDFHVAQGIDPARTTVCYNGVDTTRFAPASAGDRLREQLHLPADSVLVGTVGQIGMRKGLDTALAGLLPLLTAERRLHWIVAGQRTSQKQEAIDFETRLIQTVAQRGVEQRVHWLGYRDDMPYLMSEFDILLHAARQEPLGRVLLEAAAAGLPIVATEVGGTREIFPGDSDSALILPADQPLAITAAVKVLLKDPARRAALASTARARIQQCFTIEQAARSLLRQYHIVLKRQQFGPL